MTSRRIFLPLALLTAMLAAMAGPAEARPKPDREAEPLVIGHRGASGYRPEHTLAAYELAARQGADYIEPDLVITLDGVLVARHEPEISTTTDVADHPEFASRKTTKLIDGVPFTGWFTEDFTLAELKTLRAKERIPQLRPQNTAYDGQFEVPTFQEVVDLRKRLSKQLRRDIGIYPETKHPTYFRSIGLPLEEPLVKTLRRNGLDRKNARVFVQSFEVGNLRALDRKLKVPLVQLFGAKPTRPYDFVVSGDPRTYAQLAMPAGLAFVASYADGAGPSKDYIVPRDANGCSLPPTSFVDDAHDAGLLVHPYTFRAENSFLPCELRSSSDPAAHGDFEAEVRQFLELVQGVCARPGFSAECASEQGFLLGSTAARLRPDARFCAHGVGTVWDGAVARFANAQTFVAPRVHMRLGALAAGGRTAMLSVAKLTLGQQAYYEQQVARGLDDYYAGRGESPGIWAGSGGEGLGPVGVVEDDHLGTLLRGVNPASKAVLRPPVRERTIIVRTLDVDSGQWREEPKRLAPVSGYDLVFSCPKSVSLLHALTDDERVRREVSEAHEAAWQAALGYLEREACIVRRGKGGARRERGEGFVAAAFRHQTSRAQDPHLHTHVIVANSTRTADDKWRALDGEAILKTFRLAAGYLYEAHLRHELTRRLGLAWTEPVKGMAELEGVPEEAIRAFSTRRQSLVEHMEALGTEGFAAARVAALATRETKEQVDLPRLREEWKARAAEHGLGRRELRRLGREVPRPDVLAIDREALVERLFAPEGLTARQSTFTMAELVCAVSTSLPDGAAVERVLEEAVALSRLPGLERLELDATPGRPARFTARELLQLERDALRLALARVDVDAPRPDRKLLARMLMESGSELTGEQRLLVHEASLQQGRVLCVVGAAGAGKTTALRVLADAYRKSAVPVLGAAPSGRAADELAQASGIASRTLHRLLLDAHAEGGLPRGCVLMVDEAGMAETRVLAPLLGLVDRAEGKAILVGDPRQLPPVAAGGLYTALCERLGAISLAENRRQRDLPEREALVRLREGDPEAYLAHAARHGRLHLDRDPTDAKRRLLVDWWQVAQHDLVGSVMLAYRRADVRELNDAARAVLMRAGRLGPEAVELGEHEFRVGDRVLCRHNDQRLGVRNGTRAMVVDLDDKAVTLRTDKGATRRVPLAYAAEQLDHAYALTGHAAQGATVERAFVLLPDQGALREWGYVACTRARAETHVYLAERDAIERETPLRDPTPTASPERAARALERSALEPLALDQSRERRDTTIRLIAQHQEQLDRQRERTTKRLAAAQHELQHLHWWNRGSRAELEIQIALHRTALERADEKRRQLRQLAERRSGVLALARQCDELTVSMRPEPPRPRLEREPPGLGLKL